MRLLPRPLKPFKDALKKINDFFDVETGLKYKRTLDFTEKDFNEHIGWTPKKYEYTDIDSDAAYLNLIFNLGINLNYSNEEIIEMIKNNKGKLNDDEGKLNDDYLIKFIIINYYCSKLHDHIRIKRILEKYETDVKIIHGEYAIQLIKYVKSFLKLIFDHYCKENGKENLEKNYEEFNPNKIYKHITGKSGITNKSIIEKREEEVKGGRTRRKKRRSKKSRKSRKSHSSYFKR